MNTFVRLCVAAVLTLLLPMVAAASRRLASAASGRARSAACAEIPARATRPTRAAHLLGPLMLFLLPQVATAQNYNAESDFGGYMRQWDGPTAQAWTESATAKAWEDYFSSVGSPETCVLQNWHVNGESYNPPQHTTVHIADAFCRIPLEGYPPEILYPDYVSYEVSTCDAGYHWGESPTNEDSYGCQLGAFDPGQNNGPGAGCDGGEGHDGGSGPGPNCPGEQGSPDDANISAGDPINTATGNKYVQEDDYTGDRWLTFRRFYNSAASGTSTPMGARWSHSFNRTLSRYVAGSPTLVATRPNGVSEAFEKNGTVWTTAPNNPDRLTELDDANGAPTGYVLWIAALRHTEAYSADGLLLSVQDDTGQIMSLSYSDAKTDPAIAPKAGLLLSVTAPNGRQLAFAYDTDGMLRQVTQPDGGLLAYAHDSGHRLLSVQYPDGKSRQYVSGEVSQTDGVNQPLALTAVIDENGVRSDETLYDNTGRAVMTQGPSGAGRVSVIYNADGSSDVTYPLGGVSHQGYVATRGLARVATVDKPCGECGQPYAARSYDPNSYPSSYTDFNGNMRTVAHDANGLVTQQIDAKGSADQRTVDTTWNTTLRVPLLRTVKDASGTVVQKQGWTYNATGQMTAQCLVDPAKAPSYSCAATGTAPSGVRRTTMTYCTTVSTTCPLPGLLLRVDGPRSDVTDTLTYAWYQQLDESGCGTPGGACHHPGDLKTVTDGAGLVTTYVTYDRAGRPTRVKAPNGVLTDSTYTPRGWLATTTVRALAAGTPSSSDATTTISYNPDGTVHSVTDPDSVATTYTYDAAHRLTDVTDGSGRRYHYTLDNAGNRTKEEVITAAGTVVKATSQAFNTLGQLTSITDGLNRAVFAANYADSYDGNGNLVHAADGLGVQRKQLFDGLDRLVSTIRDYQGSAQSTKNNQSVTSFDALDQVTGFSDPDGLNTTYDIDALNNTTATHSPDTGLTAQGFDAAGNVLTSTDAASVSRALTYDANNRPLSVTYADTTANVQYRYDDTDANTGCTGGYGKGHLTRVIEAGGGVTRCYNALGLVVKKTQTIGTVVRATFYGWTRAGRLASITTPNGTIVSYTRDNIGNVTGIKATPAGGQTITVLSNVVYKSFGPVASYKLGSGQAVSYTYDLTGEITDIVGGPFSLHIKRDILGNVRAIGNSAGVQTPTESYGYDRLYRLISVNNSSGAPLETYSYNGTGDRVSKAAPGLLTGTYSYKTGSHQLTATGNTARSVDARGDTTSVALPSGSLSLGYNPRNRLSVVGRDGATVGTYVINAFGQRVQKTVGGVTTTFDYLENNQLASEASSGSSRDYIWLGDIPVAVIDTAGASASVAYVLADDLGTPRVATSPTGNTLWQWPYATNPFGENPPTSTAGFGLNLRFPGQYFDPESGLHHNVNRDYEPASGRYLQSDPIGLDGGISTYAYVGNAPLTTIDPLGLSHYGPGASGPLDPTSQTLMQCMDQCTGRDLCITSGRDGTHSGPLDPHLSGQAMDIGKNSNPGLTRDTMQQCFTQCTATNPNGYYGQEEGNHYHFQTRPGRGGAHGFAPGVH